MPLAAIADLQVARSRLPPLRALGLVLALVLFSSAGSAGQAGHIDGAPPESRFADRGAGTVRDTLTGLEWKRCAEGQTWTGRTCAGRALGYDWPSALKLAKAANFAGHADWRVPNLKELTSLAKRDSEFPSLASAAFPNAPESDWFWSSSPFAYSPWTSWSVNFGYGNDSNHLRFLPLRVRLVRDGAAPDGARVLNDTGIDWAGNPETGNARDCTGDRAAPQDCDQGRDAAPNQETDGHAGFRFVALDAQGQPTTPDRHTCVLDDVTGLIWEVKTDDGGLRDRDWTYSWYGPDPTTPRGFVGAADGTDQCATPTRCDTDKFVADVNAEGLCGYRDWRLPELEELRSIADLSRFDPAIDPRYFPHTPARSFWSSTLNSGHPDAIWILAFLYGDDFGHALHQRTNTHVRLVRGR